MPRSRRRAATGWDSRDGSRGSSSRPCTVQLPSFAFEAALARRLDSFHRIKCVAERDLMHVLGVGILLDRGIDEEDHRHVDLLPRLQRLLGEAEALDLLEILADRVG